MRFQVLSFALALVATVANAQNAKFCPTSDVCYTVNVPASGPKDLYFQISGPSSMSWIGLGQGSQMSGANIFIVYANAAGNNVTLSPRTGSGHFEPSASTSASVTLLDGSMISNGKMIANVKCSNCQTWGGGSMDFTSTSTNWIYAFKSGSPLSSDSVSTSINQHEKYGPFQLNLNSATAGDGTVNPFTSGAATTTGSASSPSSTLNSDSPTMTAGSSMGSNTSGSSDGTQTVIMTATTAHGFLGAAAFLLLFPSGSIVIRVFNFKGVLWAHVGIQILGYIVALTAMETGVWIAVNNGELMMGHPIIGLIVVCGLFFQPFLGWGHHRLFKRDGGPNVLTYIHMWWGRVLITFGIINGFLGLVLADNTMIIKVAYASVAGVVWVAWMGLALLMYMRGSSVKKVDKQTIIHLKDYERY